MKPKVDAPIEQLRESLTGEFATGSWPSTHWTQIGASPKDPEALSRFVKQYSPALMSFLTRCLRLSQDKSEDILQDFLARKLLEKQILQEASIARGKFRQFLRTALRHFAFNWLRDQKQPLVQRSVDDAPPPPVDPFDVEWALQVIDKAIKLMKQGCEADNRMDFWGIFEGRLLLPILENAEQVSYRALTERYGFANPAATQNALVNAKRRFATALGQVVASYELDPADITEEISDLFRILASSRAGCDKASGTS